ncbi:MAG: MltA domain-containing protein [Gemmatimonadota bacterium]|nr:MAG: MltA domain-containing protein [Gemmatimonadota bacterium]
MVSRGRAALLFGLFLWAACSPPSGVGPVAGSRGRSERPLPGGAALVRLGSGLPDLSGALETDRASLLEALERSLTWFERPSSREYFPVSGITHVRAWASVYALRELLGQIEDPAEFAVEIRRQFDFYMSRGSDGRGTVLFTGYYAPVFEGSLTASDEHRYPLYRLPDDLVVDEATGETRGRRVGNRIVPYPTRAQLETSHMPTGFELVWLRDRFQAYLVHVQGSAAIRLPDGSVMNIGYAGNNGHQYVSVALELVADGVLREDELSLDVVRAYFDAHPDELEPYLHRNPRFVFFREEGGSDWPTGSLGVKVTPLRSIAADKRVLPPGGVVLITTRAAGARGSAGRLERLVLDQDSGGAIRSPGRADIYFGIGPEAEEAAGRMHAEGRMYYLFLKPERVAEWRARGGLD